MRFAFSLVVVLSLLSGCGEKLSVEQQVIATIRNMEYAAEEGLHLEFMGYVADSFGAQHGTMDRREFHRFMIFQINQNRRLRAQLFPIFVKETAEGMASAHFRVLVTGGAGLLPENGQLFEAATHWLQDDGDWLLLRADWEAVRPPEF
jgi:hypothetical protein